MSKPTDEQIVSALRRAGGGSPTYVVKNWLRSEEFGGFKNLKTSHVLYRLRKMQERGLVEEVKSPFFVFMKSWSARTTRDQAA